MKYIIFDSKGRLIEKRALCEHTKNVVETLVYGLGYELPGKQGELF